MSNRKGDGVEHSQKLYVDTYCRIARLVMEKLIGNENVL